MNQNHQIHYPIYNICTHHCTVLINHEFTISRVTPHNKITS